MRTPSLQVTKIHWKLPFQLSTRANRSDLLVPFHKKGGPLQAQIADKHVHGTSQGFLFALKACLVTFASFKGGLKVNNFRENSQGFQETRGKHPAFF